MKNVFLLSFLLFFLNSYCQKTSGRDTIITLDDKVYSGTISKIVKDDYVQFRTDDSISHHVPYAAIKEMKLKSTVETEMKATQEESGRDSANFWSNPNLPGYIKRKHNAAVGLTIGGSALTLIGTALIIANPGNVSSRTGSGYAGVYFGGAAAIGVLLDIAGIPMAISGIVKMARSRKKAIAFILKQKKQKRSDKF